MGKPFIANSLLISFLVFSNHSFPQTAELFLKTGHSHRINAIAVTADGRLFASGSADNTVKIWDAERGELLRTLAGHVADVFAAAFSPRGEILASAGYDGKIIIWNFESGEIQQTLQAQRQAVTALAFSPDGSLLASAGRDSLVKIWDAGDWSPRWVLAGHGDRVTAVAFNADGSRLASASLDGTVKLWDARQGLLLTTLLGHNAGVRSITFCPDSKLLASASDDQTATIWDAETGASLRNLIGFGGAVNALVFNPDGKTVAAASSDQTVTIWETKTWKLLNSFHFAAEVSAVAFIAGGRKIISSAADETISCLEVAKGETCYQLVSVSENVLGIAFNPEGRSVASAHEDGAVKLWDVQEGRWVANLSAHSAAVNAVEFSPDPGRLLASAGSDSSVMIWDIESNGIVHTLKMPGAVHALAFAPDGNRLATAGSAKAIRIWDVNSGRLLKTLFGHGATVNSLDFSPDGRLLASASDDYTIKLWDMTGDSVLFNLKGHTLLVKSAQLSPNGRLLASASSDNTVKIWDVRTGLPVRTLADHASSVRTVAFSPNGRFLASGGFDNVIRIWNVDSGERVHLLAGHSNDINSLAFSPDGRLLASAGPDGAIQIWDSEFGDLKFRFVNLPQNQWLVYNPAKLVYTGSENAETFAAVRVGNRLQQLVPLSHYAEDLHQDKIVDALFMPQPLINTATQANPASKTQYWFWIAGLSITGIALLIWALKKAEDSVVDLVKRFFYAAGFKKLHRIADNLLVLFPTNNESGALVYLCRNRSAIEDARVAKAVRQYRGKFNRGIKLYMIYRERRDVLKNHSLNGSLDCSSIPLHFSTFAQPSYTSACRQKLRELEKPYLSLTDPYRESAPVQDANSFFGREELLHRLPSLLTGRNHVGLFGLPKVGKTSLLHQLRQTMNTTPTVLIECESYQISAAVFFEQILRQLFTQIALMGIERLPKKSAVYGKPFSQSIMTLLGAWKNAGRGEPFVIMIDDIDAFITAATPENRKKASGEYQKFFATIRELAERHRDLVLLVSGVRPQVSRMSSLGDDNTPNPLHRFLQEEWVSFLSVRDNSSLLRELGWRRSIKWQSEAVERVYDYSGGHPWLSRCIASRASRQGEIHEVDADSVEEAALEIQKTWLGNEIGYYSRTELLPALTMIEREALRAVAENEGTEIHGIDSYKRYLAAFHELENFGLVANDIGRVSLVNDFFRQLFSDKQPA